MRTSRSRPRRADEPRAAAVAASRDSAFYRCDRVRLAANSSLALSPSVVPVNQRAGRDMTVSMRNNAPEIRNFNWSSRREGWNFLRRRWTSRWGRRLCASFVPCFRDGATPGLHAGKAQLSGAAAATEPVQFLVIPPAGVAGPPTVFLFSRARKTRASFMPGRWLEFINKDNNQNALPAGGDVFAGAD